jgi:hypothetical protein
MEIPVNMTDILGQKFQNESLLLQKYPQISRHLSYSSKSIVSE